MPSIRAAQRPPPRLRSRRPTGLPVTRFPYGSGGVAPTYAYTSPDCSGYSAGGPARTRHVAVGHAVHAPPADSGRPCPAGPRPLGTAKCGLLTRGRRPNVCRLDVNARWTMTLVADCAAVVPFSLGRCAHRHSSSQGGWPLNPGQGARVPALGEVRSV